MSELQNRQKEYDLLREKIHRLRRRRIIETDEAELFKLDKQIEEAEDERQRIEQKLSGVEKLTITCPYRGLFAFREQDAPFFFGREVFTDQLVEDVQKKSLIAVIGPSGSGKSSVVYAGLIPELDHQGNWLIRSFRPGETPFYNLSAALIPLLEPEMSKRARLVEIEEMTKDFRAGRLRVQKVVENILRDNPGFRFFLFADQFEELYTLCREEKERQHFLDELLNSSEVSKTLEISLVLTLRADFMEQALAYRSFADALQDNMLNLGPMTREELQKAIESPAKKLDIAFEPGLVKRILDELLEERILDEGKDESRRLTGSLPLLEFALTLLWERQVSGKLTHEAYETIGQVKGALARHADEVYDSLNEIEQKRLRKVIVQMVRPGEGTEDTRRIASQKELDKEQWILVQRMADTDTRLVVTGRDPAGEETVEVVHESLIRGWGRLRQWMREDRRFRTWQERLRAALHQWDTSKEDKGALLRGVPLAEAEDWLAERETDLSQAEQRFIQTSVELRQQEEAEKEAQRRRQLEAAQKLAEEAKALQTAEEQARKEAEQRAEEQAKAARREKKAARRLRWWVRGVVLVFFVAVEVALYAWIQQLNATVASYEAKIDRSRAELRWFEAEKAQKEAERQARIAKARQLAAQAQNVLETYPQRSLLLAVEALNTTLRDSPFAEEILREILTKIGGIALSGHVFAVSSDKHWLATGSVDGTVWLWDLTISEPTVSPIVLRGHEESILAMAISPDSHWLVTSSEDDTVRLWDLTIPDSTKTSILLPGHEQGIIIVAFSSDSHWLTTGSWDDTVRLWDLTSSDLATNSIALRGHQGDVTIAAFSPDNHWLATGSRDNTVRLWDLTISDPANNSIVLYNYKDHITTVVFSPDNRWLVTGSLISDNSDITVHLWDLTLPYISSIVLRGHEWGISKVVFSSDSRWLITASVDQAPRNYVDGNDSTVRLWDLTTPDTIAITPIILRGHEKVITTMEISSDNHWLATASQDGTARLWDLTISDPATAPIVLQGHKNSIRTVAFSPDNRRLVTGDENGTVRLWDLSTHSTIASSIVLRGHDSEVHTSTFSTDNRWLVTSSEYGNARLWDLTAPDPATSFILLRGHEKEISVTALSPNNRWLATIHEDENTVRLWTLTASEPAKSIVLRGHKKPIHDVVFSQNSHWLITGSEDLTARLWDLTAPNPATTSIVFGGYQGQMAISADNHWFVTGGGLDIVRLWDLTASTPETESIALRGNWGREVWTMSFSYDNHWLVIGGMSDIAWLWDLTESDPSAAPTLLRGHGEHIDISAFSSDSHWLVTGGYNGIARLWDLTASDPTIDPFVLSKHEIGIESVVFSPDNHWLVTGGWSDIRLWDLTATDPAVAPVVLRGHEDRIDTLQVSADSHWLLSISDDGIARLWDLSTSDPTASAIVLRSPEGAIKAGAFSSDSHWLITVSRNGTTRLWALRLDELIELACQTAGRNFSYTEWNQYFQGEEYRIPCAELPIHPSVITTARSFARSGDIEGATSIFQRAVELDARVDVDPKTEAQKWRAKALHD